MITNKQRVEFAIAYLAAARAMLKRAGSVKTLRRVRSAISSAKGALRHAALEQYRIQRQRKSKETHA